jgi:hypothetical protein
LGKPEEKGVETEMRKKQIDDNLGGYMIALTLSAGIIFVIVYGFTFNYWLSFGIMMFIFLLNIPLMVLYPIKKELVK